MEFRRGGPLDDRRRRVLSSDATNSGSDADGADEAAPSAPTPAKASLRAYSPAVLEEHQKRLSDLIPTRPYSISILILLGLTGIATIIALFTSWQAYWNGNFASQLNLLNPQSHGSLARWFSSTLLAAAALGAMVIYSIRSHRVDDYRGKYRIWLWASAALVWASLDVSTGIHSAIGFVASRLIGMPHLQEASWLGLYALVFGVLAIRLVMEQWYSIGSSATLGAAIVLYSAFAVQKVGLVATDNTLTSSVQLATLSMLAHLTLFAAIAIYARHVRLDAEGKLPQRVSEQAPKKRKSRAKLAVVAEDEEEGETKAKSSKRRTKASAEDDEDSEEEEKAAPAASKQAEKPAPAAPAKPKAAPVPPPPANNHQDEEDDEEEGYDEDEDEGGQRLSKSERRRLKKMQRREQRRAA